MPPVPYPPYRAQKSIPITPATALKNLSTYLVLSEKNAFLHPDARLTPGGPNYSSTGGPMGGIILHNLRRVEKGLSGETLAPEHDELLPGLDLGDDIWLDSRSRKPYERIPNAHMTPKKSALKRRASEVVSSWDEGVDPEVYARSQQVLEGEMGDRDGAPVVTQNGTVPEVVHHEDAEISAANGEIIVDKEARKEDKKRRKKMQQRQKEMKRALG